MRVLVARSEYLTPLEEFVLRAVGNGVNDVQALDELFGIAAASRSVARPLDTSTKPAGVQAPTVGISRLMLDLVKDLWAREYVQVDVVGARVVLAPRVAAVVHDPIELRKLASAGVKAEVVHLAVDRVSGHVVPWEQTRGAHGLLLAPRSSRPWSIEDVSRDVLRAAAVEAERFRAGDDDPRRIIKVDLSVRNLPAASDSPRFLPVPVLITEDDEGVHARVHADDVRVLPRRNRDRIDAFLTEQLAGQERSRFRERLVANTRSVPVEPPSLRERIDRLAAGVARLDVADPGTWEQRSRELTTAARDIAVELHERAAARVDLTFVTDAERHGELLNDRLKQAQRQIVLVGPRLNATRLNDLLEVVIPKMQEGVRVILLWGRDSGEEPSHATANLLHNMKNRFPKQFIPARRSVQTRARFAVVDDQWALVTGCHLLAVTRGTAEAGVAIAARPTSSDVGGALPCPPIEDLLRWTRDEFPDNLLARTFLVTAEHFRGVGVPVSQAAPHQLVLPDAPPSPSDTASADEIRGTLNLWQLGWQNVSTALEHDERALAPHVDTLITNSSHPRRFDLALRTASRHLIVTSQLISPRIMTDHRLALLDERLAAGVDVRMVFGRWDEIVGEAATDRLRQRLSELRDKHGPRFVMAEVPGWYANVLVHDHAAVVGSFDWLSSEGHHRPHRSSRRSELSVAVAGSAVADQVAAEVCARAAVATPIRPPTTVSPTPEVVVDGADVSAAAAVRVARELIVAPAADRRGLIARLDHDVDYQALLATMDAAAAGDDLIAHVAASLLAGGHDSVLVRSWTDRLVRHLFRQRRFVEALVVQDVLPAAPSADLDESAPRPTAWDVKLGAHVASPLLDRWLGGVDVYRRDTAERRALGIVASVETISPRSPQPRVNAYACLTRLLPGLSGPAASLPALAVEHIRRYGVVESAQLDRLTATGGRLDNFANAVLDLRAQAERWRYANVPGQNGILVQGLLDREGGPASTLSTIAADLAAHGPAADAIGDLLRDWWREHGADGADALYDRLQDRAGHRARTYGRRRTNYIERSVQPVLDAVVAVLQELDVAGNAADAGPDRSVRALSRAIRDVNDDVVRTIETLPWSLRDVAGLAYARLDPVLELDR